jgi:DNA-binding transcriptional ArsR family regulator
MAKYRIDDVDGLASVAKALADSHRLRALHALRGGELCQCQIVELLGLAPSTVSRHMSVLRQAGLVVAQKRGRWVYFGLSAEPGAAEAMRWTLEVMEGLPEAAVDAERLAELKRIDPEELCRKQCKK